MGMSLDTLIISEKRTLSNMQKAFLRMHSETHWLDHFSIKNDTAIGLYSTF